MGKKKASARKARKNLEATTRQGGRVYRPHAFDCRPSVRRKRALKILDGTDAELVGFVRTGHLESMDAIALDIATNDMNDVGGFARLVRLLDQGLLDALIKPFEGLNAAEERYSGWQLCGPGSDDNAYFMVVQCCLTTLVNIACIHRGEPAELNATARVLIAQRMGCLFALAHHPSRKLFGSATAGVHLAQSLLPMLHNVLLPPSPGQSVTRHILFGDPACGPHVMPTIIDALFATGDQLRRRHKGVSGWPLEPMVWSCTGSVTQDPNRMLLFRLSQGIAALNEVVDVGTGIATSLDRERPESGVEADCERFSACKDVVVIADTPVPQCGKQATLATEYGGLVCGLQLLSMEHPDLVQQADWDGVCYIHSRLALATGPRDRPGTHAVLGGSFIMQVVAALRREIETLKRIYALEPMLSMLTVCALDQAETPCDIGVASLVHHGVLQVGLSALQVCDDRRVAANVAALFHHALFVLGTGSKSRKALVEALPGVVAASARLFPQPHAAEVMQLVAALETKLHQLETARDCVGHEKNETTEGRTMMCMFCHEAVPAKEIKKCANCGTPYCSAKCQKSDWKHGNPPHKRACKHRKASLVKMRAGMSPLQHKAAERSMKSMSEAANDVLADRMRIIPMLLELLPGLDDDIRQCVLVCDLTTKTAGVRVEPVPIDAFLMQRAPSGLEDLSDGLDPHSRAVIERNRKPDSPLFSAVVLGAGSTSHAHQAPSTIILKSMQVEFYEAHQQEFAELASKVIQHCKSLQQTERQVLIQRLIYHGSR